MICHYILYNQILSWNQAKWINDFEIDFQKNCHWPDGLWQYFGLELNRDKQHSNLEHSHG